VKRVYGLWEKCALMRDMWHHKHAESCITQLLGREYGLPGALQYTADELAIPVSDSATASRAHCHWASLRTWSLVCIPSR
jgi:hypothetical protein